MLPTCLILTYPFAQLNSMVEPKKRSVVISIFPLTNSPGFLHRFSAGKLSWWLVVKYSQDIKLREGECLVLDISVGFCHRTGNRMTRWLSYTTRRQTPKASSILLQRYLHKHVHCHSIHSSKELESTLMFTNYWQDDESVVHIHQEYYSAVEQKGSHEICI